MATVQKDICVAVQSASDASPFTIYWSEKSSQTFKKGWVVNLDGSGYLQDPASDTPSTIMGIAEEDAHNDTTSGTHSLCVAQATLPNIFEANMLAGSLADYVITQADIGRVVGIQRDTSNNRLFLNSAASAATAVTGRAFTIGLGQGSAMGDTNARVRFVFLSNYSQANSTS